MNRFGGVIGSGNEIFYDAIGNPKSQLANLPAATAYSGLTDYTYDCQNQVLSEQSTRQGNYNYADSYDGAGNLTTLRNVTHIGYNLDNQLSNATLFTYDGNGNPTTYNGATCTFDPENRMTAYGSTVTAGYTADGLRGWKQNSAGTTYYLYDQGTLLCELNGSGAIQAINTVGWCGLLSRHTSTGSVFYTFDPQGNVAERLDSNGNVLGSYMFDAFGARNSTDNSTDPYSGYGSRWGYYRDSETGLSLLEHRYYDANVGRFINRDPIDFQGGINIYAYSTNNPLTKCDPSGLSPSDPCAQGSGGGPKGPPYSWEGKPHEDTCLDECKSFFLAGDIVAWEECMESCDEDYNGGDYRMPNYLPIPAPAAPGVPIQEPVSSPIHFPVPSFPGPLTPPDPGGVLVGAGVTILCILIPGCIETAPVIIFAL